MVPPVTTQFARTSFRRAPLRNAEPVAKPPGAVDEADIDTIELHLRPEELAWLSKAGVDSEDSFTAVVEPLRLAEPEEQPSPDAANPLASISEPLALTVVQPKVATPVAPPAPAPLVVLPPPSKVARAIEVQSRPAQEVMPSWPSRDLAGAKAEGVTLPAPPTPVAEKASIEVQPWPPKPKAAPVVKPAVESRDRNTIWNFAVGTVLVFAVVLVWVSIVGFARGKKAPEVPPMIPEPDPVSQLLPVAASVAALPVPPSDPVKFANPFDRNEIFEFPAGTSQDEARDAVAQILMERARERRPTR